MKIWIKTALLVLIVANLAIESVLFYVRGQLTNKIITSNGDKLRYVASVIATFIDGDKYQSLKFDNKVYLENPYYKYLTDLFVRTKTNLMLKEEIYTLNLIDTTKAVFGIMTNDIPFAGDTLHLLSKTEKEMLEKTITNKTSVRSEIYDDQYGMWISGMAPILNSADKVVGVVQVDHESSLVLSEIGNLNKKIFYFQLMIIPLLIFLSIVFSKLITHPVSKLIKVVDNISKGNYEDPEPIRAFGEVKELVQSTDLMRKTILEQQQKIFNTVSELKKNNKELFSAKEKAEEMTRLKSIFLANISHELRTPLIGAIGFAEILNDEISEDDHKSMLKDILISLDRLLKTLNSLIELAAFESEKPRINLSNVKLNDLINETLKTYAGNANSKGLYIEKDIPDTELVIRCDKKLLHQVLNNIIDNAIKFTQTGGVKISVNCLNSSENKKVEIKIADTGTGIPGDCYDIIFNEFRQASEGLSRKFEGLGLGLPIAKKYTALLGGKISVKSEINKGSLFTIELPA